MELQYLRSMAPKAGTGCFSIVRNEIYLLPFFLDHYRALGVSFFVFYDDHSTDGTRELLAAQSDCIVVTSAYRYNEVLHGGLELKHHVRNYLPEMYGNGGWFLTVDADEFLILPTRFSTIDDLTLYLDKRDLLCVHAPMIGFYPETLARRDYNGGVSPFAVNRWFDRTPSFLRLPHLRLPVLHSGGMRYRLAKMLEATQPEAFRRVFGKGGYLLGCPWKVPLLKTGQGLFRANAHGLNQRPPLGVEVGLAHFKLHPDFDRKVADAIERKTYFRDSIEYRFWHAALELLSDEPLICPESVEFDSAASVEAAGLIWAD